MRITIITRHQFRGYRACAFAATRSARDSQIHGGNLQHRATPDASAGYLLNSPPLATVTKHSFPAQGALRSPQRRNECNELIRDLGRFPL